MKMKGGMAESCKPVINGKMRDGSVLSIAALPKTKRVMQAGAPVTKLNG